MKISFSWLQEFVEIDLSPRELAKRLTMAGIEVEAVEEIHPPFESEKVVVGRIADIQPHPQRGGLSLCRIDVGKSVVPIVCGAQNIAVGDLVPVALPGAHLADGRHVQEATIHGERSVGMLSSEKELGLGEDSTGILILDKGVTPGVALVQGLGLRDHILEVAVTPNRGDCLSHWGMAREVAAVTGAKHRLKATKPREDGSPIQKLSAVAVMESNLCPRYAARVVQGVTIRPSPFWLKRRLTLLGLRPINNVVDATNYVLLEMGQPLHAFDHARLEKGRIVVRRAKDGERIVTLDGVERRLDKGMLVIADAQTPVALAGVMGGATTEVTETTKDLLLESALFEPVSVRRTAKALGLSTGSSYRFERGVDPEGIVRALDRVAGLITGIAGGRVARGVFDLRVKRPRPAPVVLRVARVREILGMSVPQGEITKMLGRVYCRVTRRGAKGLVVSPPSHRLDLSREIDLVEEVARLRGFDRIPSTLPGGQVRSVGATPFLGIEAQIRRLLTAWGFQEAVNFSFTEEGVFDKLRLPETDLRRVVVRIHNPLGGEAVLRSILVPSLLENLVLNESRGIREVKLFEIARIFRDQPGAEEAVEGRAVGIVAAGDRLPVWWGTQWGGVDFYDLKGVLEAMGRFFGLSLDLRAEKRIPFLHPGRQVEVLLGPQVLGWSGEVHPEVLRNFGVSTRAVAMEINLDLLDRYRRPTPTFRLLPRYPAVLRDMAVVVQESMPAGEVEATIRRTGGALVEAVHLFDVYQGDPVSKGKKSLAFSIQYRSSERTLTDGEVATIHGEILQTLEKELGAILR
ncbi:MAG: phenylalanine--tRNA ligase subunit beta [Candidatus Methylomirabilales bacterium]